MNTNLTANINKYYSFELLIHFVFYTPVFVIFLLAHRLTLTQISLIFATHSLGALIFDLPGGVFADYFTKKASLVLGSILWGASLLSFTFLTAAWQFAAAAFIGGIGQAFMSGADQALIHETLSLLGRAGEYKKIEGHVRGLNEIAAGLGVFLGGLIANISLPLTLLLSAGSVGLSSLSAATITSPPKDQKSDKVPFWSILPKAIAIIHKNYLVLWLTLYFALFVAFVWATQILSQPYLKLLHAPLIYFGPIFAGFGLLYALSSIYAHKLDKFLSQKFFISFAAIVPVAMIILGSAPSLPTFILWASFGIFETANLSLVSSEILKIIPRGQATTILSFQSFTLRFINILVTPLIGFSADKIGIFPTLQLCGLSLLVVLLAFFITSKNHQNYQPSSAG